jgi:hypothetical protein
MRPGFRRQVDARIAAVVIIAVLAGVQLFWWKGLVSRPRAGAMRPNPLTMRGGNDQSVLGRSNVTVTTISGSPEPGDTDGQGRNARFDGPSGLAIEPSGSILAADCRNHRIRRVEPTGKTMTVAGSVRGFKDGNAAEAQFDGPSGVAIGADGTIYVADTGNNRIRTIKNGVVSTLAGGEAGFADGIGGAARFNGPVSITVDGSGGIIVADALNSRIRYVTSAGAATSEPALAGKPTGLALGQQSAITVPDAGTLLTSSISSGSGVFHSLVPLRNMKAGRLTIAGPEVVCAAPGGYFLSDRLHRAVFQIRNGAVEVLAGICFPTKGVNGYLDSTGDKATFGMIAGMAFDGKRSLYVADLSNNCIRKVTLPE